jgi:hypothetical protein
MEVTGQLRALANLFPEKEALLLFALEARWTPEQVWTRRSKNKSLAPTGNQTPAVSLYPILLQTKLWWFPLRLIYVSKICCYDSVHNLLSSRLLSKNLKIRI